MMPLCMHASYIYMKDSVRQSMIYTRGAGGFGWDSWSHLLIRNSHTSDLLQTFELLQLFSTCFYVCRSSDTRQINQHMFIVRTLFPAAKLPITGNITLRAMSSLQSIRSEVQSLLSIWRLIYWIVTHRYSFHDKHLNYHLKKKKKLVKIYLICRCCGWAL